MVDHKLDAIAQQDENKNDIDLQEIEKSLRSGGVLSYPKEIQVLVEQLNTKEHELEYVLSWTLRQYLEEMDGTMLTKLYTGEATKEQSKLFQFACHILFAPWLVVDGDIWPESKAYLHLVATYPDAIRFLMEQPAEEKQRILNKIIPLIKKSEATGIPLYAVDGYDTLFADIALKRSEQTKTFEANLNYEHDAREVLKNTLTDITAIHDLRMCGLKPDAILISPEKRASLKTAKDVENITSENIAEYVMMPEGLSLQMKSLFVASYKNMLQYILSYCPGWKNMIDAKPFSAWSYTFEKISNKVIYYNKISRRISPDNVAEMKRWRLPEEYKSLGSDEAKHDAFLLFLWETWAKNLSDLWASIAPQSETAKELIRLEWYGWDKLGGDRASYIIYQLNRCVEWGSIQLKEDGSIECTWTLNRSEAKWIFPSMRYLTKTKLWSVLDEIYGQQEQQKDQQEQYEQFIAWVKKERWLEWLPKARDADIVNLYNQLQEAKQAIHAQAQKADAAWKNYIATKFDQEYQARLKANIGNPYGGGSIYNDLYDQRKAEYYSGVHQVAKQWMENVCKGYSNLLRSCPADKRPEWFKTDKRLRKEKNPFFPVEFDYNYTKADDQVRDVGIEKFRSNLKEMYVDIAAWRWRKHLPQLAGMVAGIAAVVITRGQVLRLVWSIPTAARMAVPLARVFLTGSAYTAGQLTGSLGWATVNGVIDGDLPKARKDASGYFDAEQKFIGAGATTTKTLANIVSAGVGFTVTGPIGEKLAAMVTQKVGSKALKRGITFAVDTVVWEIFLEGLALDPVVNTLNRGADVYFGFGDNTVAVWRRKFGVSSVDVWWGKETWDKYASGSFSDMFSAMREAFCQQYTAENIGQVIGQSVAFSATMKGMSLPAELKMGRYSAEAAWLENELSVMQNDADQLAADNIELALQVQQLQAQLATSENPDNIQQEIAWIMSEIHANENRMGEMLLKTEGVMNELLAVMKKLKDADAWDPEDEAKTKRLIATMRRHGLENENNPEVALMKLSYQRGLLIWQANETNAVTIDKMIAEIDELTQQYKLIIEKRDSASVSETTSPETTIPETLASESPASETSTPEAIVESAADYSILPEEEVDSEIAKMSEQLDEAEFKLPAETDSSFARAYRNIAESLLERLSAGNWSPQVLEQFRKFLYITEKIGNKSSDWLQNTFTGTLLHRIYVRMEQVKGVLHIESSTRAFIYALYTKYIEVSHTVDISHKRSSAIVPYHADWTAIYRDSEGNSLSPEAAFDASKAHDQAIAGLFIRSGAQLGYAIKSTDPHTDERILQSDKDVAMNVETTKRLIDLLIDDPSWWGIIKKLQGLNKTWSETLEINMKNRDALYRLAEAGLLRIVAEVEVNGVRIDHEYFAENGSHPLDIFDTDGLHKWIPITVHWARYMSHTAAVEYVRNVLKMEKDLMETWTEEKWKMSKRIINLIQLAESDNRHIPYYEKILQNIKFLFTWEFDKVARASQERKESALREVKVYLVEEAWFDADLIESLPVPWSQSADRLPIIEPWFTVKIRALQAALFAAKTTEQKKEVIQEIRWLLDTHDFSTRTWRWYFVHMSFLAWSGTTFTDAETGKSSTYDPTLVRENAGITDDTERISKIEETLSKDLTTDAENACLAAHYYNPKGQEVFWYDTEVLKTKMQIAMWMYEIEMTDEGPRVKLDKEGKPIPREKSADYMTIADAGKLVRMWLLGAVESNAYVEPEAFFGIIWWKEQFIDNESWGHCNGLSLIHLSRYLWLSQSWDGSNIETQFQNSLEEGKKKGRQGWWIVQEWTHRGPLQKEVTVAWWEYAIPNSNIVSTLESSMTDNTYNETTKLAIRCRINRVSDGASPDHLNYVPAGHMTLLVQDPADARYMVFLDYEPIPALYWWVRNTGLRIEKTKVLEFIENGTIDKSTMQMFELPVVTPMAGPVHTAENTPWETNIDILSQDYPGKSPLEEYIENIQDSARKQEYRNYLDMTRRVLAYTSEIEAMETLRKEQIARNELSPTQRWCIYLAYTIYRETNDGLEVALFLSKVGFGNKTIDKILSTMLPNENDTYKDKLRKSAPFTPYESEIYNLLGKKGITDAEKQEIEKNQFQKLRDEFSADMRAPKFSSRFNRLIIAQEILNEKGMPINLVSPEGKLTEMARQIIFAHLIPDVPPTIKYLKQSGFTDDQIRLLCDNMVCGIMNLSRLFPGLKQWDGNLARPGETRYESGVITFEGTMPVLPKSIQLLPIMDQNENDPWGKMSCTIHSFVTALAFLWFHATPLIPSLRKMIDDWLKDWLNHRIPQLVRGYLIERLKQNAALYSIEWSGMLYDLAEKSNRVENMKAELDTGESWLVISAWNPIWIENTPLIGAMHTVTLIKNSSGYYLTDSLGPKVSILPESVVRQLLNHGQITQISVVKKAKTPPKLVNGVLQVEKKEKLQVQVKPKQSPSETSVDNNAPSVLLPITPKPVVSLQDMPSLERRWEEWELTENTPRMVTSKLETNYTWWHRVNGMAFADENGRELKVIYDDVWNVKEVYFISWAGDKKANFSPSISPEGGKEIYIAVWTYVKDNFTITFDPSTNKLQIVDNDGFNLMQEGFNETTKYIDASKDGMKESDRKSREEYNSHNVELKRKIEYLNTMQKAKRVLWDEKFAQLSAAQRHAIRLAHIVWYMEPGKNGKTIWLETSGINEDGTTNYKPGQLGRKLKILEDAGFDKDTRAMLVREGVCGLDEKSSAIEYTIWANSFFRNNRKKTVWFGNHPWDAICFIFTVGKFDKYEESIKAFSAIRNIPGCRFSAITSPIRFSSDEQRTKEDLITLLGYTWERDISSELETIVAQQPPYAKRQFLERYWLKPVISASATNNLSPNTFSYRSEPPAPVSAPLNPITENTNQVNPSPESWTMTADTVFHDPSTTLVIANLNQWFGIQHASKGWIKINTNTNDTSMRIADMRGSVVELQLLKDAKYFEPVFCEQQFPEGKGIWMIYKKFDNQRRPAIGQFRCITQNADIYNSIRESPELLIQLYTEKFPQFDEIKKLNAVYDMYRFTPFNTNIVPIEVTYNRFSEPTVKVPYQDNTVPPETNPRTEQKNTNTDIEYTIWTDSSLPKDIKNIIWSNSENGISNASYSTLAIRIVFTDYGDEISKYDKSIRAFDTIKREYKSAPEIRSPIRFSPNDQRTKEDLITLFGYTWKDLSSEREIILAEQPPNAKKNFLKVYELNPVVPPSVTNNSATNTFSYPREPLQSVTVPSGPVVKYTSPNNVVSPKPNPETEQKNNNAEQVDALLTSIYEDPDIFTTQDGTYLGWNIIWCTNAGKLYDHDPENKVREKIQNLKQVIFDIRHIGEYLQKSKKAMFLKTYTWEYVVYSIVSFQYDAGNREWFGRQSIMLPRGHSLVSQIENDPQLLAKFFVKYYWPRFNVKDNPYRYMRNIFMPESYRLIDTKVHEYKPGTQDQIEIQLKNIYLAIESDEQ